MTPEELDLDTVRNKALCPVFQTTLKTPETAAVVLDMAKDVEKSRKTWESVQEYFRTSVYHQNTKSSLKTGISNHRWANMQWTGTFAQFALDLERKINDCDQVAEEDERHDEKKKKDSLKQAILGCPDLVSLEMFENLHRQKHGKPVAHKRHRAMVMDMCGSLDIANPIWGSSYST